MAVSFARHDALFPLEVAGHRAGADRLGAPVRAARRHAPSGRTAGGGAAGHGPVLHQARPGAVDPRRSVERGSRGRSRAPAGPYSGLPRRRGATDHRKRAGPAARRRLLQFRRRAGGGRLDRAGALRGHDRRPRRRGEGAAARHREGLRAGSRPLLLDGRAGRAHAAALPPPEAGRIGARLRRRGAGRDGPAHGSGGRRGAGREFRRRSRTTARPGSTGIAPPNA